MNLTSKLILHLDDDRFLQPVPAVQGDTARSVEVVLYAGGQPWDIPPEATASIRYRRQDGAGGVYEEPGTWRISGNTVTVTLKPEVLGVPGVVTMQIALHSGEEVLSTFSFQAQVQADPSRGTSAPGVPSQGGTGSMELQPLTFTGAVAATYDGTKPVRVNIPTGGSNYTLPVATADKLGGVQPVAKSADMTQSVGVDEYGGLWTVPGGNGGSSEKETLLINYTAAEPVSMVDIPITEEMRTAIADATCIRWRLTLSGDETATDTTGYGTAELMFWCGWGVGTLLPVTSNLVPSAANKSWAVGNVNGYVFKSAAIGKAGVLSPTAKDVNTKNFDLCCVCYDSNKSLFSGAVIKMNQANTVLRLTTSLPIGTGSRIILAVS